MSLKFNHEFWRGSYAIHVVAARKRSHQWCLTLQPQTVLKQLKDGHVIVFCNQSGETLWAAPTQQLWDLNRRSVPTHQIKWTIVQPCQTESEDEGTHDPYQRHALSWIGSPKPAKTSGSPSAWKRPTCCAKTWTPNLSLPLTTTKWMLSTMWKQVLPSQKGKLTDGEKL